MPSDPAWRTVSTIAVAIALVAAPRTVSQAAAACSRAFDSRVSCRSLVADAGYRSSNDWRWDGNGDDGDRSDERSRLRFQIRRGGGALGTGAFMLRHRLFGFGDWRRIGKDFEYLQFIADTQGHVDVETGDQGKGQRHVQDGNGECDLHSVAGFWFHCDHGACDVGL